MCHMKTSSCLGGAISSEIIDYFSNLVEYRVFLRTAKSGRFTGVFGTWFREMGVDTAPD
jgi:hypothetical protein